MIGRYGQLCTVAYGAGAINSTGETAKELGFKKVMIVTDKQVEALGHSQKAIDSLKKANIETVIFNGVEMDAPDYTVEAGGNMAKKEQVDGIIGIGGGSVLDTAKGIACFAANEISISDMIHHAPMKNPPVRFVLIPTTPGTGSESTFVAVITDTKKHEKVGCFAVPSFSILDPELTLSLPKEITAYTGMDAFSHCIESLTSMQPNPHSDLLAYDAIERSVKWLPVAYKDPNNYEARDNLALASNFAGKSFNDSTVHVGHAIAHSFGAHFHIPHGIGCALVTPVVIELTASKFPEKIKKVGKIMDIEINSEDPVVIGKTVADGLRKFMKSIEVPSCKELGITREEILNCTDYVRNEPLRNFGGVAVTDEMIPELLAKIYDTYQ
ncbi:iron-containing alcohol dehydrogenase [Clostridium sp. PL3]|uniref:Iron-containing alcohol dehydrogenase n=1 Tax=Clostridium thailandense TaxID=2794346 RepID=A0A949TVV8_9CLOT|nr:iron-containing alcohol dehydrogenase [Clostridium thailandense]MBV7273413.1 iron-containing alcohol dehydrogenase [Clostridium thailandense]